jgi:hypothetical protein
MPLRLQHIDRGRIVCLGRDITQWWSVEKRLTGGVARFRATSTTSILVLDILIPSGATMSEETRPTPTEQPAQPKRTGPVSVRITDIKMPFASVMALTLKFYIAAFIIGIFFFVLTTLLFTVIGSLISSVFQRMLFAR